jgi:hypothetical protein
MSGPECYNPLLGEEPDPLNVERPFPAELMRVWPISTWGNKPEKKILQFSYQSSGNRSNKTP